jgi:hypothetical protein
LARLLGRFGADEPSEHQARDYPYLLPIALGVAAFEVARRWRRKSKHELRRCRNFVLSSLL